MIPIWWGTHHRSEPLGFVVDRCGACGQVAMHTAHQHFKVPHVYSIPLGRGTPHATSVQCAVCSVDLVLDLRKFAWLASYQQSVTLPLKEIIRITNPALLEVVERRERLEEVARNPAALAESQDDAAVDPKVQLAVDDLRDVQTHRGADALLAELEKWPTLDESARTALLRKINAFVEDARVFRRTLAFARLMAISCPSGSLGCALSMIAIPADLSAFIWWPATRSLLWGTLLVLGSIFSWLVTFVVVSSWITRSWVKRTLIVQGDRQGIRYDVLVRVLSYLAEEGNESGNEDVKILVTDKRDIIETLVDTGRIELDKNGNYRSRKARTRAA